MATHRPERLADLILGHLARIVREEVRDPRIGFVTLTDVAVSPDLKHARVFVSLIGSEADREAAARALNRASSFLRRRLAAEAGLRHTPALVFVEDSSLERGSRIEDLLRRTRDDAPPPDAVDTPSSDREDP